MAGIASLVVSLEANVAKFSTDMQRASETTTRTMKSIESSASIAKNALAGLASVFSVDMIVNWAKDTIAAASALDDLADATGSSVEELSKLANIATVSGVQFSTIDAAIKKLAVGMAGIEDETGKAGKALSLLGIQTKDPALALQEIAAKFATYEDGANKAALAVAIFGKQGASLLPVLKDMAEQTGIGSTVTAEQAKAAEDLEKAYRRMGMEATTFKNILLSDVVPAITATITSFNLARAAGLGFWDSLATVGNYGPAGIAKAVDSATESVAKLQKQFDAYTSDGAKGLANVLIPQLENAKKQLAAFKAIQDSINKPIYDAAYPSRNSSGRQTEAPTISDASIAKVKKAADGWKEFADAIKAAFDNALNWELAGQEIEKNQRAQLEVLDKMHETNARNIESVEKTTEGYQKQIDALTMTEEQLLLLDRAKLQAIVDARLYEGWITAETEAMQKQLGVIDQLIGAQGADRAAKSAKKAADDWAKAANDIGNSLTDALLRGFESGKDFAQNFVATLKNMFSTLVLRPIIQGILAPVAGGISGMLGSGSAAASGLGGAANLFGGGSSLLGSGGIGGLFSGAGGIFGAGAIGNSFALGQTGQALGLSAFGLDTAGGLGLTGLGTTLGAAIPLIGAALAIASMAGVFSSKGGPKQGGTAGYGNWYPGETSATGNTAVASIVTATEASYKQLLAALGGGGSASFSLGYDTDPNGTAQSRVSSGAMVGGRSVYGVRDLNVGRDEAGLTAALETQSKRALLAAMQASDLPAQIAAVFNSVAAESASSESIDSLLAFGGAMKVVIDAISGSVVEDAQAQWEQSQRTTTQILRDMGSEVIRLAADMDGSTESMTALASATTDYRAAVVQTLLAIKQISVQVEEMFAATRDSLETFGLSPEALYDRFRADADAAYAELQTATDPAQVQRLSERINADINAAFGALDDAGKTTQQNPLLEYLNGISAIVQSKLTLLGADISSATVDPFAAANAALDGAALKFDGAAATQKNAADLQYKAAELQWRSANTPITVRIPGLTSEVNA
jgi:hypothetical protein